MNGEVLAEYPVFRDKGISIDLLGDSLLATSRDKSVVHL